MYKRPTNEQIIKGVEEHGSVSAYARAIDMPRRTVAYWYKDALQGKTHRTQVEGEQDLFEPECPSHEEAPELKYIHDQVVSLVLPDSGWRVFTEEEINDYFLKYSSKGNNMTQLQIRNHFDFSARDWSKIKKHFGIYKLSNVFWDFSFDAIPAHERERAVEERLASVFKNPNHIVDRAYTKLVQSQAKKTITEGIKQQAGFEAFLTALAAECAENPIPVLECTVDESSYTRSAPYEILTTVSDLHLNARVEGLDIQDFNNEIVEEYLDTVAIETNSKMADGVVVLINGDIIESLTGKNHPDSFVQMEYGQTYAQGIITARDIIMRFLAKIHNLKKVLVISGNHDRMTSSNKEDDHGGVGRILAEFLKFAFKHVTVGWSAKVLTHETENINYIASHGDKRFSSKDANALLWKYGVKGKQNVLLTGHFHHRSIKVDDEEFRHISLASLFTGNTYSDHGGFTTKPGFAIFEESFKGELIHTDYSL